MHVLITVNGKGICALIGRAYACAYSAAHCACAILVERGWLRGGRALAVASEGEVVCVLEGVVYGHHIYKETWTLTVGEMLAVLQEPGNLKLCLSIAHLPLFVSHLLHLPTA